MTICKKKNLFLFFEALFGKKNRFFSCNKNTQNKPNRCLSNTPFKSKDPLTKT